MTRLLVITSLVLLGACSAERPAPTPAKQTDTAALTQTAAGSGERHFGAAPSLPGPPLAVTQLMADPEPHLGKQVKCEGTVARVCQNAGCWLELQAEAGKQGLRVPMANHAFFIPKDAVGQRAVVEGSLQRQELPDGQRAHYQSEGMQAVGPLSLEASSVVLSGS